MIHGSEEREVVLALDDSKGEAPPLQRTRYVDDMATYLIDRHVPLRYRGEFDVGRIADRMPDELAVVGALEPASEGVVPAQIRVEGMVHGGDIAIPRNVTAGYDLPGKIQPGTVAFVVITKMLSLHVADRHRTHRCLPGFLGGRGSGVPGRYRARIQRPFIKCANRYRANAQNAVPLARPAPFRHLSSLAQHTLGLVAWSPVTPKPGNPMRHIAYR
ncbi:Uncharacterised protein [Mycobacteroides abscessus subsp. abscessus]|nr:Uncharacterised protein [Mycobacteroides abscessus subsp. abscessus]